MRAGHIAHGVNHRQHHQPESQSDAHMGDGVIADIVDDDCARAGEHQRERAEEFGDTFFHRREARVSKRCGQLAELRGTPAMERRPDRIAARLKPTVEELAF